MKAIMVGILMLVSTLALAAPAAAECVQNPDTGTDACVNVDPAAPQNRGAHVNQAGVANANYYAYEYSFWGMTYRGEGAAVSTAHDGPAPAMSVMVDSFCFVGRDGSCMSESRSANVWVSEVGRAGVSVDEWNGETTVCYSTHVNGEFGYECVLTL